MELRPGAVFAGSRRPWKTTFPAHESRSHGRPLLFYERWCLVGGRAQSECEAEPLAPGQQPLPEVVGWHHTQTHPSAILGAGPTCRSDHDSLARRDLLTRPHFGQATHGDSPLRTRSIARWERALADSAQTDAKGHLLVNWYWWGTRARQAIASRARSICCGRWCCADT